MRYSTFKTLSSFSFQVFSILHCSLKLDGPPPQKLTLCVRVLCVRVSVFVQKLPTTDVKTMSPTPQIRPKGKPANTTCHKSHYLINSRSNNVQTNSRPTETPNRTSELCKPSHQHPQHDKVKEPAMCKHSHSPIHPNQYKLCHTTACTRDKIWPICKPDQQPPQSKMQLPLHWLVPHLLRRGCDFYLFWLGPLNLSLKFEEDMITGIFHFWK